MRAVLGLGVLLAAVATAPAQSYIGFAYPAGGQQGTTFQVTLGGQGVEGINRVFVSGSGVTARLVEFNKRLNNQENQLLNEQLREIRPNAPKKPDPSHTNLIARLEKLLREFTQQPACVSISNLMIVEVAIAADAEPGQREIRIGTPRGLSNPLVFSVSQVPEFTAPPLPTCPLVTLGKEGQSLRKKTRAPVAQAAGSEMMTSSSMMGSAAALSDVDDEEQRIAVPCTVNGQISPGSVDRYRFGAHKGQRLVVSVQARELVPYLADAVPGWFQPVVAIWDLKGKQVAYKDDYRFKPDPVILCEIPEDGEYMLAIYDAIYRGREDFVYRATLGELPFVTSIFPIGGPAGKPTEVEVKGWNLTETRTTAPSKDAAPGVCMVAARGKGGLLSNRVPFAMDTLPECLEKEPNDQPRAAQRVSLPVIVNGRIEKPGDRDQFQFEGRAGEEIVAEITARRLESPLDSVLKLTHSSGRVLAFCDDREDLGSGLNTHHADSYLRATLPSNGLYRIQLGDTQHNGGEEYAYRLRIGAPQPDFALRVVPSSMLLRTNSPAYPAVHVIRKDGFAGPIRLRLKNAPEGIEMIGSTLTGTQTMTRVTVKTRIPETPDPFVLTIEGVATNGPQTIVREAVPAEDRMQAFLWRHLVPAKELKTMALVPPPLPPKPAPPKPVPPVPLPQGLVLHFGFDDAGTNGMIQDRSGLNNVGRPTGIKWTASGRQGGGCEFMSTNNTIQVPSSASLNVTQATVAVWFRTLKSDPVARFILEKNPESGFALCVAGDSKEGNSKGKLRATFGGHSCLSDGPVIDGVWRHAAATFDGENVKLYVDGQLQKQVIPWRGAIPANGKGLTVGANLSNPSPQEKGRFFEGAMDEVMVFNRALSAADVQALISLAKPKFSRDQVARRMIELKELRDRGLLLQPFYDRKAKECEAL